MPHKAGTFSAAKGAPLREHSNHYLPSSQLHPYLAPLNPLTSRATFKLERGRARHSRGPDSFCPPTPLDTEVESRHEGTLDAPKVTSTGSRPVAPLTFKATARILAGILAVSPKNKGLHGGDRQDPGGTTAAIQRGIIHR